MCFLNPNPRWETIIFSVGTKRNFTTLPGGDFQPGITGSAFSEREGDGSLLEVTLYRTSEERRREGPLGPDRKRFAARRITGSAFSEREGDGSLLEEAYYRINKELTREGPLGPDCT